MTATPHLMIDSIWNMNIGATLHITSDLKNLTINSLYQGLNIVQVKNDEGLVMKHIESSHVTTSSQSSMLIMFFIVQMHQPIYF